MRGLANPRVLALVAALLIGALAFGFWPQGHGLRAAVSFLGGAAGAGLLLFGGIAAVQLFASVPNGLSLMIALTTYLTTVGLFAAVLAAADPDVVDGAGVGGGLLVMAVASTVWQWRLSRVPSDRAAGPAAADARRTAGNQAVSDIHSDC
jgi:hypothetical protein